MKQLRPDQSRAIDQNYLHTILHYSPETGVWVWLFRPTASVQWNGHFARQRAGSLDSTTGYWRIRIGSKLYYAHRLAFVYMLGRWPLNEVDHKNLDRADCSWKNLREATHSQNGANKPRGAYNKSGFKGVSFNRNGGKWVAETTINGKRIRKWGFATAELAFEYYQKISKEQFGDFARS